MTAGMVRTKPPRLCYRAVEFRAANPGAVSDGRTLEGYAAVFDTPTEIDSWEGSFNEVIARGAFKRSLNARMPVLQFDHGRDARTGSVPIGAIQQLREDKTGLFVSARLFDNAVVEPIRQAIEGKAIDGMSFRFRVVRDVWTDNAGKTVDGTELLDLLWSAGDRGPLTRTIQEVELFELGPVVFPAYASTSVGVRSMLATLDEETREHLIRELLSMLRESASTTRGLAASGAELRTAVAVHHTGTVDTTWDAGVNEKRLPSPMSLATAKDVYAWYDSSKVEDDEIVKDACKFPHHEVAEDGTPGAANLDACRNGLARLPDSNVPESEQDGVRNHLQAHLDDGDSGDSKSADPLAETPPDQAPQVNEAPPSEGLSHAQPEPAAGTSGGRNETQEPAASGTSAPVEPAARTSAYLGTTTDWWLPAPEFN